jgi:hypothetical protein
MNKHSKQYRTTFNRQWESRFQRALNDKKDNPSNFIRDAVKQKIIKHENEKNEVTTPKE